MRPDGKIILRGHMAALTGTRESNWGPARRCRDRVVTEVTTSARVEVAGKIVTIDEIELAGGNFLAMPWSPRKS